MLGYDARAGRAAWSVFLVALLLVVVYFIRRVLLVFVLAVLFAYLLSPVVNLVDRSLWWKKSRTYSLAIVYALLVGVLIAAGILIGNKVVAEASALAANFPHLVDGLKARLSEPGPAWLQPVKHYIVNQVSERGQSFGSAVLPIVQRLSVHAISVLSSLVFVVLIPILSFFFLKDGSDLKEQFLSLAGVRRPMWEDIVEDLNVLLGQFIRALVILSLATLTVYAIVFAIFGLPYSALVACFAALLEFIPVVGPLIAAATILVVAAVSGTSILAVLCFLAVYRVFQDYVLSPHLMGAGIAMHPLLVIFGALAGHELAGIPGMFLSVPVLATLRVGYVRLRKARGVAPASVTVQSE
jgi:predicted PurR-regulated permease PerM